MNIIKTVETLKDLKRLFDFLTEVFYDEAVEYNEHYFTMSERYEEMKVQFEVDKNLLMYIEKRGKIVAGITAKGMKKDDGKITLGVMAVAKSERRKGLAKELVLEFEKRCKYIK